MQKILFLMIGLFLLLSCGNRKQTPNIGEKCQLKQECLSAVDNDSFNELNSVCNRKDEYRLKEMISLGLVYILQPSYECTVVEKDFSKVKIRFDDLMGGKHEVWVSNENIK